MKSRMLGAAAVAALSVGWAGAAAADTPAEAPEANSTQLSEVIVTAQRRSESAQSIGVAVTALSGQDLVTRGVNVVNQLQYSVPSLEVVPAFGGGQPQYRIRGVGFDDYASNNTSPVTVYVDEVAYPFPVQTQGLLFDLKGVEVLRGPQGTLYGRNTTGGAINFATRAPTADLSAGVLAEYASHNQVRAEAYVSGPVSDKARFRISAGTEQGGAWQKNRSTGEEIGDSDKIGVRAQLALDLTEKFSVLFSAHYARDKGDGQGLYLFRDLKFNAAGFVPADSDRSKTGWGGSSVFAGFVGFDKATKPFKDNEAYGFTLHANYDLGFAKLSSISAFEHFNRSEYQDWDASQLAYAGVYFDTRAKVFSEELRLTSQESGPLKWVAGAYYSDEKISDTFDSDFWQSFGFVTDTRYRQSAKVAAIFGQIDYRLSDRLNLVVGLRDEQEKRTLGDFQTIGVFAPGVTGAFIPPTDRAFTRNKVSGKLGLEFHATPNVLYYASLSRGIKSGGYTAYNTPDAAKLLHVIEPEELLAYEVGFKSDLFDRRVRLNGAAYYYDYKNQQVQSAIYTAFGPIGNIVNADSFIYGADLELAWKPAAGLTITQALGYKKGEFTDFNDLDIDASIAAGSAVYRQRDGEKQGYPAWSYIGSVNCGWDLGGYSLDADVNYAFRDKLEPVLLGPTYNVDSYWLANASLTLRPARGPWSISIFGRNVFDQKYDQTRNFFLPGISIAAPGRPSTWGVRLSASF